MVQFIYALLLALGIIINVQQYDNATPPEKQKMHQKAGIIDTDINM
jgi:hypothetical protein